MLEIIQTNDFEFYLSKKVNFKSDKANLKWYCFEYNWLNQLGLPNFKLYYSLKYNIYNFYGTVYSQNEYVNFGMTIINCFLKHELPEHYFFKNGLLKHYDKCFVVYLFNYNASNVFIKFKINQMLKLDLTLIKNCNYNYILNTNQYFKPYLNYKKITQSDKYKILFNILKNKTKINATY
jgi:hypothetical protein